MQNLKLKIRRALYSLRHDVFTKDHSFLLIVAALCLIFVVSSITAMSRNWELEQKLEEERATLSLLRLEVETAELENAYYHSEEYQELSARQHLNKKLPGETLIYLPENSPAAKAKHSEVKVPEPLAPPSNFSQWLEFLFGI